MFAEGHPKRFELAFRAMLACGKGIPSTGCAEGGTGELPEDRPFRVSPDQAAGKRTKVTDGAGT